MSKSGILKLKSKYEEKKINLELVCYSSKLFRDDVKALDLDRENHLIPAPYDANLMISRYDVRATISDIAPYEAVSQTFNRLDGLSEAEKQAEMLAEEERYYSLYRNEVEEEMYKEEQMKREASASTSSYSQVAFNYDQQPQEDQPLPIGPKPSNEAENEDETPFVASEKLNLPPEMKIPPTEKLNQIIEKTAKFISKNGPQMEILLKTKQASNPQFNFLNHDGQYNAYYKHILVMMKNNSYPWQEATKMNEAKNEENFKSCENGNGVDENGSSGTLSSAIFIPKIQYKPSADCAYTQLISKITKAPISELERKQQQEESSAEGGDKKKKVEALGLLQSYNSSDESESEDEKVIPPEIQVTIDKTALYVAKNGPEFEEKLKDKQSETFKFLNADNEYHSYYKMKVKQNQAALNISTPSAAKEEQLKQQETVKVLPPKTPPPPLCISFSIKSKEEKQTLSKSTIASSDEELNQQIKVVNDMPEAPSPPKISISCGADVEEELERQVDIINAEKEEKLAKERLNDKLLISARERLGMLPKDKMLQIERKKRAMMFINRNIKGSNGSSSNNDKEDERDLQCEDSNDSSLTAKSSPKFPSKHSSRSRSRRKSRSSRSSSSSSSSSTSSRSDSSPRRKRSKKSKSRHYHKRKHRRYSRSRSRSRHRSRSRSHHKKYSSSRRRKE